MYKIIKMKNILIFLILLSLSSFSQQNTLSVFCDCYKTEKIEDCLKNKYLLNQLSIDSIYDNIPNSVVLVKELNIICPNIINSLLQNNENYDSISEKEKLNVLENIAVKFTFPITKGNNICKVNYDEYGILYNFYFDKVYPDSIYKNGKYKLIKTDSLIVVRKNGVYSNQEICLVTKDEKIINIKYDLEYTLKKKRVGVLISNYSEKYEETFIKPVIDSLYKEYAKQYTKREFKKRFKTQNMRRELSMKIDLVTSYFERSILTYK